MSHWKTDEIKTLIENATESLSVNSVTVNLPGGDVDTEVIIVSMDDDKLWICGFTLEDTLMPYVGNNAGIQRKIDPSDMDIEAIEVTDGKSSGGGLNSKHLNTSIVYAHIVSILRENGHAVVPTMSDYF